MARLALDLARVDFHHHFELDAGPISDQDRAGYRASTGWPYPDGRVPWTPELSLSAMDDLGIEFAVLSMKQGWMPPDRRLKPSDPDFRERNNAFHHELNELAHSAVRRYPDRFGFFASLPLESGAEASLAELAYGLDELGADGLHLPSSYGSGQTAVYIGADALDPIWDEADSRELVVFIHGSQTTSINGFLNNCAPTAVTEVGNETFKAAADLVTRGKRRRYPKPTVILSHSGGATPVLAARAAVLSSYLGSPLTPEQIIDDFKTFYYETALSGFETNLVALENLAGIDQMLYGTDFPAVEASMSAWYTNRVDEYYANRPTDLGRIMHDTARTLLPRLHGAGHVR
jgi:predicted TIM-barrel fold metal-dependent hydrolase